MRLKGGFCTLALSLAVIITGSPALALDPIPKQAGFSGYVQPGLGYLSIKSNMVAKVLSFDLSDQKINSLSDEPDSQSTALFSLPFKLAYTFAGGRTQVFLGTEVGDLLSFDTAQQLAIKQDVGALGVMQAGLLFSGATRVWKDPYVTGQNRDDTDRKNMGAQFTWDKMFGSNLELEYSIRKIDIGSEKSGEFLGLSNSNQDRLDRNGVVHKVSAAYQFQLGEKHRLTPEIALSYDDLDGEAMANTGVDLKLNYSYFGDPITLVLNGYGRGGGVRQEQPDLRQDPRGRPLRRVCHRLLQEPLGLDALRQRSDAVLRDRSLLLDRRQHRLLHPGGPSGHGRGGVPLEVKPY